MPEPLTPYTLTSAEAELFELVSLAHEQRFSVTISRLGDAWTVKLADADVHEGQGTSFGEAWASMRTGRGGLRLIQGGRADG